MSRPQGGGQRRGPGTNRATREKAPRGRSRVGERFEVTVGSVAHGGHCVARVTDGEDLRVVFVRHTLPGEQIVVEITEGTDGDRFWRGDAVQIVTPAADRVEAPCPVSGPGLCGGCDFQHVSVSGQRDLKAAVVREQLARLAKLDVPVSVQAVPGDVDGLRWRTRQRYVPVPVRDENGNKKGLAKGLRKFRSHDVVVVEDCLIAAPEAREPGEGTVVETVTVGDVTHSFMVASDGFWQVHPGAPTTLVSAVLEALNPQPGETVLDLYAGVGLFSAFLADRVGPEGRVVAIEGDPRASALSADNVPSAEIRAGDVTAVLRSGVAEAVDLVVLDPPREGARRAVVDQIVALSPRAVAYVACDPAALARDVALFAEAGYELKTLRAFDLFPMTHHVECVALLERSAG